MVDGQGRGGRAGIDPGHGPPLVGSGPTGGAASQ
jgi:hypothetical protein